MLTFCACACVCVCASDFLRACCAIENFLSGFGDIAAAVGLCKDSDVVVIVVASDSDVDFTLAFAVGVGVAVAGVGGRGRADGSAGGGSRKNETQFGLRNWPKFEPRPPFAMKREKVSSLRLAWNACVV
jgi:hypothetical protein